MKRAVGPRGGEWDPRPRCDRGDGRRPQPPHTRDRGDAVGRMRGHVPSIGCQRLWRTMRWALQGITDCSCNGSGRSREQISTAPWAGLWRAMAWASAAFTCARIRLARTRKVLGLACSRTFLLTCGAWAPHDWGCSWNLLLACSRNSPPCGFPDRRALVHCCAPRCLLD